MARRRPTHDAGHASQVQPFGDGKGRPEPAGPWSKVLTSNGEHSCVYSRQGNVFDHTAAGGHYYVGSANDEVAAIALWSAYIQRMGWWSE